MECSNTNNRPTTISPATNANLAKRYEKSMQQLARAEEVIPLGAQTFSKSRTQFPFGSAPYFAHAGKGAILQDIDGNEYIDYINSLCAVTLGYCDPDVDATVKEQLTRGVLFSLSHELEEKVARQLVELIPSAEKVRFGKNGSDATAGAIRVARAFTGRDHVAICGYHGWQDWYIGSTARNQGVPKQTQALSHTFTYNNIESLEKLFADYPGQVAAVILEPITFTAPQNNFLEQVKELTHKHGAVLIFDEIVSGFRYANGGAQEYFGVTPDLTTLGKGMANGFPISAVVGRADIMKLMEEVFFSFTNGGETLSLAAAHVALEKYQKQNVTAHFWQLGETILQDMHTLIDEVGAAEWLSMAGLAPWLQLKISSAHGYTDAQIRTLFFQEVFAQGVLTLGTFNLSFAHSQEIWTEARSRLQRAIKTVTSAITSRKLEEMLQCDVLVPLFQVRGSANQAKQDAKH